MSSLRAFLLDVLALIVIWEIILVAHPILTLSNTALTDYDLFTYFYPFWSYRAEHLSLGDLPLWNPYTFTGVPFLANIQTGVLYLPNLLFLGMEPPRAAALSYVGHLYLAGAGMYLLLRWGFRCGVLGGMAAAVIFSLGGFMGAQAGHINQVQAASWLPFISLATIQACRHLSVSWAMAGAVMLGMQVTAGHPQELYLSSVAVALLGAYEVLRQGFVHAPEGSGRLHPVFRPPAILSHLLVRSGLSGLMFVLLLVLGVGSAMFQLLPTLELTNYSLRSGGLPYTLASSFSLPPYEIITALLPTYKDPPFSEYNAYVGIVGLGLAWIGITNWRRSAYAPYLTGISMLGLFLAIGGYNPLYRFLYDFVPGLDLFRVPARWLLLPAFGLAALAGIGVDAIWRAPFKAASLRTFGYEVASVLPPLLWGMLLFGITATFFSPPPAEAVMLWLVGAVATAVFALFGPFVTRGAIAALPLVPFVVIELLLARAPLPISHPVPAEVYRDLRPPVAQLLTDRGLYRVLNIANPAYEPGDLRQMRAALSTVLSPEDADNYIIATKYKETLNPNMGLRYGIQSLDGYDGGLLPLKDFAALKDVLVTSTESNQALTGTAAAAELIRDGVLAIPDVSLLSRLNVKYIVADRLYDAWVDGAYIDLGTAQTVRPGESLVVNVPSNEMANRLLLATFLQAYSGLPPATLVANVTVTDAAGGTFSWPLRVGVETAASTTEPGRFPDMELLTQVNPPPSRRVLNPIPGTILGTRRGAPNERIFLNRLDAAPFRPTSIRIENMSGSDNFVVAGLAFVDTRTQTSYSPPLHPQLRRTFTGDVKIYENLVVQPRAQFANRVRLFQSQESQLKVFQILGPQEVALAEDPLGLGGAPPPPDPSLRVNVDRYAGDDISLSVATAQRGYVVLSDAYYPGWRAWVDGVETPILKANGVFRAVPVQPGEHKVYLKYEPVSLLEGWQITQLSLYIIGLLLIGDVLVHFALFAAARWRLSRERQKRSATLLLVGRLGRTLRVRLDDVRRHSSANGPNGHN